jgi:HEAT repeat protein
MAGERPSLEPPIQELIDRLGDSDTLARRSAAVALGALGRKARMAVLPLAGALRDPNAQVRRLAALALGDIGSAARPAIPALAETLRYDEHAGVRRRAAVALGELGTESALLALRNALHDEDARVGRAAAQALELLEPAAPPRAA